jgi:hypothetical protein
MADGGKISVSWMEAALLVILVMCGLGLGASAEWLTAWWRQADEPKEEAYAANARVSFSQAEAALAQSELNAIQSKWNEQRLESAKHAAALDYLKQTYPAFETTPEGAAAPPGVPPEAAVAFAQAQLGRDTSDKFLKRLEQMRATAMEASAAKASTLSRAEHAAKRDFNGAVEAFARVGRWITLGVSVFAALLLMPAAGWLISVVSLKKDLQVNARFVAGSALVVTLVLLAYQTFQVAGAVLGAMVIALAALLLVLRQP